MKKMIALILIIVLAVPAAFADPAEPTDKYSTYGSTDAIGNIFPGKYFSMDVFMSFDLSAYIIVTVWDEHDTMTMTKFAHIKTKQQHDGNFYLLFADDTYYTFHYDDEAKTAIWIDIDGVSIKLNYSQWIIPTLDVKR